MAAATTTASGSYSIGGLADGTYSVRASHSGFVPQIQNGVTIVGSGAVTVNLGLNVGIAIHSPVAASVINDYSVLVTGLFDTSLGTEVGINVNGYVALKDGDEFAGIVSVGSQTTSLTATVTNSSGVPLGSHTIPITPQLPSTSMLVFRPSPALTLVSQPVQFKLDSQNPIAQVELDANSDGTIDFTGSSLIGVQAPFAASGLYFPTVRVTEVGGTVRTATAMIQVFDLNQLDALLQSKWEAMKAALRGGNINGALNHIIVKRRATYQAMLNALTVPLSSIDQVLPDITFVEQRGLHVQYRITSVEGGFQYSYMVLFTIDEDGVWRIKFF